MSGTDPARTPSRQPWLRLAAALLAVVVAAVVGVVLSRSPAATSAPGAGRLRATGPSRPLPSGFLGFNGEALRAGSARWLAPALRAALARLGPGSLRVFGGTTANYWQWRTGTFAPSPTGRHAGTGIVTGGPRPAVPLNAFAADVRAAGAVPVFDLNLVTAGLADQLAMLHAAAALGLPVRAVELGNELYVDTPDNRAAFPTAAAYAARATTWAAAIHRDFPAAAVGVVGYGAAPTGRPRTTHWNADVLAGTRGEAAMTFHSYWAVPAGTDLAGGGAAAVLAAPLAAYDRVLRPDLAALPAGVHGWLTEFNYSGPGRRALAGRWAQGLGNAAFALRAIGDPAVTLADCHSLLGSFPLFAALTGPPDGPFRPTATGNAFALLLAALRPAVAAAPLAAPAASLPGGYATVQGDLLRDRDGHGAALLVNLGDRPYRAGLPAGLGAGTARVLAFDPAERVAGWQTPRRAAVTGTLTLPAYSLTWVQD